MAEYTQDNRPIRVETALGKDVLLLTAFNGIESISMPFSFELDMLSTQPDIVATDVLRTPVAFAVKLGDGSERIYHGICNRFTQAGRVGELAMYRMSVVPWFWLLSMSRQSAIYQNKSVLEIAEEVFQQHGFSDFEIRCTRSYETREFCVQYRETDLNFVSRLLEEEGIFYFFEFSESKHLMVLADNNDSLEFSPGPDPVRFNVESSDTDDAIVHELEHQHALHTGKYTLWDYDFEKPKTKLEATLSGDGVEEIYDFPGGYRERADGDRLVRLRLEAEEMEGQLLNGKSNCRHFVPGHKFTLSEHFNSNVNGEYLLTQIQHFARAGRFDAFIAQASLDYHNHFQAIPIAVPYRPKLLTEKPVVHGSQTALVVGPPGEEIYVDPFGRIRLYFYWDRREKKDQDASAWVRVGTTWAGKGYGAVSLPRIGNEVIVAFQEGDPDQPIVVGSVHNADQTPPFDLPGSGIQMGMKSRSSPGGGGDNEVSLLDTKDKEKLNIHAQYDMSTSVGHDQTNAVSNDRTTSIAVDDKESIGSNQEIDVGADQKISVAGNQTTSVSGNQESSVGGNRSASVSGNDDLSVGGNQSASVGGNADLSVSGNYSASVSGNAEVSAQGNLKGSASANAELSAGAEVKINGGAKITLSAGGSTIEIGPAGVTVSTGAMISMTGSMIKLN